MHLRYRKIKPFITTTVAAYLFFASMIVLNAPVLAQDMAGQIATKKATPVIMTAFSENATQLIAEVGVLEQTTTEPDSTGTLRPTLASIPELSWRTPEWEGRELTEDLAQEYPRGNFITRTVSNGAWNVGEHLVFSIDYGFINAGTATMSVLDTVTVNGGPCYHIRTTAISNRFISSFYEVRDMVDSFIDMDGLFSRRLEKHLREGKYESDRVVDFYHDRLLALNTQNKFPSTEIPLYVQDILSVLYYIRTFPLEVKKTTVIEVYADGKVYPLDVLVHKRERIKVPAGTFNTLVVEPKLKSEGLFRQKGKLLVWLTDDERKMPVKMTSEIAIGSIGSNLESYRYGE